MWDWRSWEPEASREPAHANEGRHCCRPSLSSTAGLGRALRLRLSPSCGRVLGFRLGHCFRPSAGPGKGHPRSPRGGRFAREVVSGCRTISTLPALLPASHCTPSAGPSQALGWALIPPAATPLPVLAPRSRRNTARERTAPRFGRDLSAVRAGWKVRVCRSCERRAFAFQPPRAAGLPGSSGAVCQPG
jgi:hypothetical protein